MGSQAQVGHNVSYHGLGLLAPNRYEVDLSNEVLNIDFSQGTAKISEVKVGLKKISANSADPGRSGSSRADRQIFFFTSNFDL